MQLGAETVLDDWSLGCQRDSTAAPGPDPPGLGGHKCRPAAPDSSETEYLVMAETFGVVYLRTD